MELIERCQYLIKSYMVSRAARVVGKLHNTRLVDGKAAVKLEHVIPRFTHAPPEKGTQAWQPDSRPGNGGEASADNFKFLVSGLVGICQAEEGDLELLLDRRHLLHLPHHHHHQVDAGLQIIVCRTSQIHDLLTTENSPHVTGKEKRQRLILPERGKLDLLAIRIEQRQLRCQITLFHCDPQYVPTTVSFILLPDPAAARHSFRRPLSASVRARGMLRR